MSDGSWCPTGTARGQLQLAHLVAQAGKIAREGAGHCGVGQNVVEHDVGGGHPAWQNVDACLLFERTPLFAVQQERMACGPQQQRRQLRPAAAALTSRGTRRRFAA